MSKKVTIFLLSLLFILIATGDVYSVNKQWVGSGTGNGRLWSRAANWSPSGVPTSSDDVYFNSPTAGNCQIDADAYCYSFNQATSPGTRDFSTNATLTVGVGGVNISGGALAIGSSSNIITVAGNWIQTGGTFNADAGTIVFDGPGVQTIQTLVEFYNVTINNPNGVLINSDLIVNGVLSLTSGVLGTGQYSLIINQAGSVTRTSGHVYGNMQKYIPIGAITRTFEIGGEIYYTPLIVSFNNVATAGKLTAEAYPEEHYLISSSPVNESKDVNRFWILSNSGIVFDHYSATFNFVTPDKDPGTDPTKFVVGKLDGSDWSLPTIGTRTGTSTQATGMTTMSDFVVGEIKTFTITASADANGSISPGDVDVNWGSDQLFEFTPNEGFHIGDVVVDGGSVGIVPNYTFTNVKEPHTISVNFLADTVSITATAGLNGTISPEGNVRVPSLGNQMFTITPDEGYHVLDVLVDGSSVGSVTSYEFTNVIINHSIDAIFAVDTFAITSSTGFNGTIDPLGTIYYGYDADITYTINPEYGYHIDSVIVDDGPVDSTTSYTFYNITENHTIRVVFAINHYTIYPAAGLHGTIEPNDSVDVEYNSSKTFDITPEEGYHVDTLMVDGVLQTPSESYTFYNIESDHFIYVTFAINYYAITADTSDGGEIEPAGTIYVVHGGSQHFAISPRFGYHLDSLFVDGLHVDSILSYTFDNVISDRSIYASFAFNTYIIMVTKGDHGTIIPADSAIVEHGSDQQFSILPEKGYHLDSLFVDDEYVDSTTSYTFYNVIDDHSIRATFGINMYMITPSAGPNGSIDPDSVLTLPYGSDQIYTIIPSEGHHIDSLIVDGVKVDSTTSYTFYNIASDHTIRAVFTPLVYSITATKFGLGSISPSGVVPIVYGQNQKFTMTPAVGFDVVALYVDDDLVDSTQSYTFNNVSSDHTIHAIFGQVTNPLPTLTSITPINGNRGETFNVLFAGTNFAPGITSVYVGEGITVNYIVFYPSSSESLSANITIQKSAVPGTRNFAAVNAPPGGGSSTSRTFTILNSTPTAPRLFAPSDQATIMIPPEDPIDFIWKRSIDLDIVDTVKYSVHIWGSGFDTTRTGLKDSSISMDIVPLLGLGQWYRWTVKATDGFLTTISPDTFTFRIERAVNVDDLLSQIPTEYALYQNYPNPFNPSTKIQVDIPSQAVVTLKVYNLLGTEVLSIVDRRLMDAGIKFYDFNASDLPSGIYFYRLTANGIDGKLFTSVKRMMLMK